MYMYIDPVHLDLCKVVFYVQNPVNYLRMSYIANDEQHGELCCGLSLPYQRLRICQEDG